MAKNNLAVVENRAMSIIPDYLKEYQGPTGHEDVDSKDMTIPRLKLAQAMSPEVKDKLVADGDLFHSVSKRLIAKQSETVVFIPIVAHKEYLLWRDRKDGGGIMARARPVRLPNRKSLAYQWDKPNTAFEHKLGGNLKVTWKTGNYVHEDGLGERGSAIPGDPDSGPAATAHHNFIVCLPEFNNEILAMTFSRTSEKAAKQLNYFFKQFEHLPIFWQKYSLRSVLQQNASGDKFFNYDINTLGAPVPEELFNNMMKLHLDLSGRVGNMDFAEQEEDRPARVVNENDDPSKW